jgi:adenylylsulfate kinase-like enzyme
MSHVIWITGLSAAGKTTLATAVTRRLREEGTPVVMLDGDELREALAVTDTHTRDSRLVLAHKYSRLALMIACQGVTVVVGTVALFKEIHAWNRENLPGYFEVYLRVPLDELRRRDPKGIYKRFDAGKLTDVAGLDLPVDEPAAPHLLIEYKSGVTPDVELDMLLTRFRAFAAR